VSLESKDELYDKSMADLLARLSRETTLLIRQEIDLAKAELATEGRVVGQSAAMFGVGTLFGLGAFGAVTALFILALATVIPGWAAALIVAVVYGAVAGLAALSGKKRLENVRAIAPKTVESLKENVEWAKTRTKSDAR